MECKIVKLINKGANTAQIQMFKGVGIKVWWTKAMWNMENMLFLCVYFQLCDVWEEAAS